MLMKFMNNLRKKYFSGLQVEQCSFATAHSKPSRWHGDRCFETSVEGMCCEAQIPKGSSADQTGRG